ncbi:Sucraseferredoxin-like protein [Pilobolus umbonatus]|nr:Sucraseferredoxin-like protein [Pilobolus umbonatus]
MDQIPPEDLLVNDCSGCHEPCAEHEQYPSYLDLDNETPLLGTMKPYGRHILISTAKMDWAERIEEENNTIAARLSQIVSSHPTELRTIITNTSMPSTHSTVPRSQDIFILPENIIVSNVTPNDSQLIFDLFVKPPLSDQPVTLKTYQSLNLKSLKVGLNPYKSMILICSHKRRDKRCGITAPLLYHELDYVLREKEVDENDTVILYVSHVGGHKYAGNVICYVDYGKVGVWYGRVKTCHCKEIVEETVLKGKVIKELYRGSMKKSFGTDKCNRFKW